jgi:hypothetical protein
MWEHQAGRIDFNEPLQRLLGRGWAFREYAPLVGGRGGSCWAVVGTHGVSRVQVECVGRREAWVEAMRLAEVSRPMLAGWSEP